MRRLRTFAICSVCFAAGVGAGLLIRIPHRNSSDGAPITGSTEPSKANDARAETAPVDPLPDTAAHEGTSAPASQGASSQGPPPGRSPPGAADGSAAPARTGDGSPVPIEAEALAALDERILKAARDGGEREILEALRDGARLEARDEHGMTPLLLAIEGGDLESVLALLAAGADPTAADAEGMTALHLAAGHAGWRDFPSLAALLLRRGARMDARDREGRTPLHAAARRNSEEPVRFLAARGATIDAQDGHGRTPLHIAAGGMNDDSARALLSLGAQPDARDADGWTPLHRAAAEGGYGVIRALLEAGADPQAETRDGWSALSLARLAGKRPAEALLLDKGARISETRARDLEFLLACRDGDAGKVRAALAAGADARAANPLGGTPLHEAVERGRVEIARILTDHGAAPQDPGLLLLALRCGNPDMLRFLLAKGMNPNEPRLNRPPLTEAAVYGKADMAQVLLAGGADLHAGNESALFHAIVYAQPDVVSLLLSKGAALEARSGDRQDTPLLAAVRSRSGVFEERGLRIVAALLRAGADVQAADPYGLTALHRAASLPDVPVAALLIERGANVNAPSRRGWTPLMNASLAGSLEMVGLLIRHGADVNRMPPDRSSDSPLRLAIGDARRRKDWRVVSALLSAGADPNAKDAGWTPVLHDAVIHGPPELVRLLLDHGADPNARDPTGRTPLQLARQWRMAETATLLEERGGK